MISVNLVDLATNGLPETMAVLMGGLTYLTGLIMSLVLGEARFRHSCI